MVHEEYVNLIHSEMDGTISERDRSRLHEYIEKNPTAREEYEDLQKVAALLKSVQEVEPPLQLKAAILNEINSHPSSLTHHQEIHMAKPFKSFFTSGHMSAFERLFILGGALASIAVLIYVSALFPPPSDDAVEGTISGAKKYRSEQITRNDVQLSDAQQKGTGTSDAISTGTNMNGREDDEIVNRTALNDRSAWFSKLSVNDKTAIFAKTSMEDRVAAFARMSMEERATALAALPVNDRAAMYARIMEKAAMEKTAMEKTAMTDKGAIAERATMFDRLPVSERISMYDRLPIADRSQMLDRLPVSERVSVFDRLSVAEKMQSLDRLPAAERTSMFDRLSVSEKSFMDGRAY